MKTIFPKLSALLVCFVLLAGCGQEPLKLRNLIEADLYIRNNIPHMEWQEFQLLLSNDNDVTEKEFSYLKSLLSKGYKSKRTEVNNKLYRFDPEDNLLYMTKWEEKDDLLYLEDIYYVSE